MFMRRFAAFLCTAVLCLTMTGCGGAPAAASMVSPSGRGDAPEVTIPVEPVPLCDGPSEDCEKALRAMAAALASYPEGVSEPREDDYLLADGSLDFDAFDRDYAAWMEQEAARPAVPESVSRLADFFRDAERQFLSGGTENRACSPLNIYFALCLIAEVTDGESRAQVLRLLDADSIDSLRAQANQIWNALYKDDGTSSLISGSSLWLREGIRFKQDTLNRLAENYYASSFSGSPSDPAFTAALRTWLNQQTKGLLKEQAGNISLTPDTVAALASTLYFKAPWLSQFEEALTRPDVFHAPSGDMNTPYLHKTLSHSAVYAGDGFTAMPLPMDTGRMWLILPDEGITPDALLQTGTVQSLLSAPEEYLSAREARVSLSLPRFDVTGELDLIDGLKTMGVTDVFDSGKSDFSPLTEDAEKLEITSIRHAARVKIDEEGCEAAAFTVSLVELTAAMDQPQSIDFTLDRPFLFAVAGEGDLPLFAGVVNVPEAA